jgi:hypothetical protein
VQASQTAQVVEVARATAAQTILVKFNKRRAHHEMLDRRDQPGNHSGCTDTRERLPVRATDRNPSARSARRRIDSAGTAFAVSCGVSLVTGRGR